MHLESRCITSIGGGIELRPSKFKHISRNRNSPKLREIAKIKSKIKIVGKIAKSGNWIRSNSKAGGSRINTLPVNQWTSSKSINGEIKYSHHSRAGDKASLNLSHNAEEWTSITLLNGSQDIVRFSKGSSQMYVSHPSFPNELKGEISASGKKIEFYQ